MFVLVTEMQAVKFPEFPTLRGHDAVNALTEIINEFEQQKGKELTEKQAQTLMKVAGELIYSIKEEMLTETSHKYKPRGSTAFKRYEDSEKANQETCKEHRKSHHLSSPTFEENCTQEDCSADCPMR